MTLAKDFEDFIKLLNLHNVEYMVVGGYALALHGKPRHTGDMDIWINISENNAERMLRVFKEFGVSSLSFTKEDFLKPGYVSQIGFPPLRIDILNTIDGIAFKDAAKNMNSIALENNFKINYIGLHDFVKNKQATGRIQDLADIREIKKIQAVKNIPKQKRGKRI
jgi:hypothetical protein